MKAVADHLVRGRGLLLGAAVLWSTNGLFIKLIYADGSGPNGVAIAFYRSLIATIFLAVPAMRRIRQLRYTPWLVASVLAFTLMTVMLIVATTLTTAANAIILEYTSVFWVFALSSLILGESVDRRDWPLLMLAMFGVGIIFFGSFGGGQEVGVLVGLLSGFGFGILTMILRRLRDVNVLLVMWINNLGSTVLLFPWAAVTADLRLSQRAFFLVAIMGVFQFAIPYLLFTGGLKYVPAAQASLILLLEPVLNPIWVWTVVGEAPAATTIIGGAVLITTVAWQSLRR